MGEADDHPCNPFRGVGMTVVGEPSMPSEALTVRDVKL